MKQLTDRFSYQLTDYCVDEFFPQYDILKISANGRELRNPSSKGVNFLITKAIYSITGLKALATAYNCSGVEEWNDMAAYIMFRKSDNAFEKVRPIIEEIKGLKVVRVDDVSGKISLDNSFKFSMVQLLLGYMDNNISDDLESGTKDNDVWNNTMGKTVYFGDGKDWHRKWTDTTDHYNKEHMIVWSGRDFKDSDVKVGMSIRVNQEGILLLNAESYVLLDKKTAAKARLTFGYSFDKYGRFLPAVLREGKKYWFKKGEETVRPNIHFVDYGSVHSFESSRMGVLAKYLERIDMEIGSKSENPLVEIKPWCYTGDVTRLNPVLKDKEVLKKCVNRVKNKLTLSLAGISMDDYKVSEAVKVITDTLHDEFGIKSVGSSFDDDGYNLLMYHDKDYYINRKKPDVRTEYSKQHPKASIQGITFEQFVSTVPVRPLATGDKDEDEKNIRLYKASVEAYNKRVLNMLRINIISLAIKRDLMKATPKISIVDVTRFHLSKPLFMAVRRKEGKRNLYFYMKLWPDGKMSFAQFDGEWYYEKKEYGKIVRAFQTNDWSMKDPDSDIELVAWNDIDDIYRIVKTIEHPVPAVIEIYDELRSTDKTMTYDELCALYDDFKKWLPSSGQQVTDEEIAAYDELMRSGIANTAGRNITYKKLQGMLGYKYHRHMYNAFNTFLSTRGIKIDPHLRNNENKDRLGLLNLVDGYHFPTPDYEHYTGTLPYSETYCIGSKNALERSGLNRGFLYRRIERINKQPIDKAFIETLLNMNIVDFVKLGQWTVRPFPVKYLNEYCDLVRLGGGLPEPKTPLQKSLF